jgi:hypothetical protein
LREERSRNPAATMKSPGPARRAAVGTLVEPADVDVMAGMFQREKAFIYMDVNGLHAVKRPVKKT